MLHGISGSKRGARADAKASSASSSARRAWRGRWTGLCAVAVVVTALTSHAQAALVASWNLNGIDPAGASIIGASTGLGTLDTANLGGGAGVLQGTTLGALPGELAGDALAVVGNAFNGRHVLLEIPVIGYGDLVLSFATRRSSTGFSSNRLEYWSSLGWMSAGKFASNASAWEVQTFTLGSLGVSDGEFLRLRLVVDGATSSSGSIRFDNIALSGSMVPAPAGALALIGLASGVARRRRS